MSIWPALVKAGYFDLILTTNFDLFLENALMDAGLRAQEFMVFINGQDQEGQIIEALKYPTPRVKILKLHGDLNARIFAFTPQEVFQFTDRIEQTLTDILNGDIVVVGHSLGNSHCKGLTPRTACCLPPAPASVAHSISLVLGACWETLGWLVYSTQTPDSWSCWRIA